MIHALAWFSRTIAQCILSRHWSSHPRHPMIIFYIMPVMHYILANSLILKRIHFTPNTLHYPPKQEASYSGFMWWWQIFRPTPHGSRVRFPTWTALLWWPFYRVMLLAIPCADSPITPHLKFPLWHPNVWHLINVNGVPRGNVDSIHWPQNSLTTQGNKSNPRSHFCCGRLHTATMLLVHLCQIL